MGSTLVDRLDKSINQQKEKDRKIEPQSDRKIEPQSQRYPLPTMLTFDSQKQNSQKPVLYEIFCNELKDLPKAMCRTLKILMMNNRRQSKI